MKQRHLFLMINTLLLVCAGGILAAQETPGRSGWAICRFDSAEEMIHSNKRFVRLNLTHVADGQRFWVMIPNDDRQRPEGHDPNVPYPKFRNFLLKLSPGEYVRIQTGSFQKQPELKRIERYNLQPGEELPNNFVFVGHEPAVVDFVTDKVTKPAVIHVRKLGQTAEVMIPMVRTEQGVHQPDPAIMGTIMSLSENHVVTMAVRQVPGGVMIQQIQRYHPIRHGDLMEKTTVGFNPARTAIRITADDGESFTVLLPGRMVREEWMPDRRLSRAVDRLDVGDRVTFEVHEVEGEIVLRSIRPGPAKPKSSGTSQGGRR